MTKHKRSIWDDLAEVGKEILNKLDEAMKPPKERQPVPVPIPVRNNHPHPDDSGNPYDPR